MSFSSLVPRGRTEMSFSSLVPRGRTERSVDFLDPRRRKKGVGRARLGSSVPRLVRPRRVNRIGDRLDHFLNLLVHLVELAFDHRPNIVGLASKLAQELPQAPRHLRKALRSQKKQRRNEDDRELDTADVEHVFAPSEERRARNSTPEPFTS